MLPREMFISFFLAGLVRIEEGVVFLPNQSKIAPSPEVWQMTTFKIYDLLILQSTSRWIPKVGNEYSFDILQ
jgi:hypothetical protein